eukprot:6048296-Pyramimonas_sp.AAC.1
MPPVRQRIASKCGPTPPVATECAPTPPLQRIATTRPDRSSSWRTHVIVPRTSQPAETASSSPTLPS